MIAIAAPFSGSDIATEVATLFSFESVQALTPQSPAVQRFAEYKEIYGRIVSIYPEKDTLIPNGSRLEGAENFMVPVKGHHRILTDRRVIKIIKEKLEYWEVENQ